MFCAVPPEPSAPRSPNVAAFQASHMLCMYSQIMHLAVFGMSTDEVPVATLIKLLEPFSLVDVTMAEVQLAFDYVQACPHTPGSDDLLEQVECFQGVLSQMSFLVEKLIHINTSIRKVPSLKSNIAKLEAEGTSYVTNDALWGLMDKCIHFLANHNGYDVHGGEGADPYVKAMSVLGISFGLYLDDKDDNDVKDTVFYTHCLRTFYNKDYDECYVKAFEYIAEDACTGKSCPEEEYDSTLENLSKMIFLIHLVNSDQEQRVPGKKEALAFSGSEAVQQRIYSACLKLYDSAIKESGKRELRAGGLFALASNVLAAWGVKRIASTREGNPHADEDVPRDLVAKSDILMAKSWNKVVEMFETAGEAVSSNVITSFVTLYIDIRGKWYPYEKFLRDGAHLIPDENGKYSKLELIYDELEAMYNTAMMIPVVTSAIGDLNMGMNVVKSIENSIIRLSRSLSSSGIYNLPKGDERHLIIWELNKRVCLAAMKTAKACLLGPKKTWASFANSAKKIEEFVRLVVGRSNLEILLIPLILNAFGDEASLPKSYIKYCAALSLLALDNLKYTPETIWKKDVIYMQGYNSLALMVCLSQEILLKALRSSKDKSLLTLHKIASELVNGASSRDLQASMRESVGGAWAEQAFAVHQEKAKNTLEGFTEFIQELDKRTADASDSAKEEREISCAVERAKILSVLPCSSLSCTAVCPLGKKNIPSSACSGCRVARYCSGKCQKKDWKVHKVACKALAAADKS